MYPRDRNNMPCTRNIQFISILQELNSPNWGVIKKEYIKTPVINNRQK